jgi:hypothetical protein
VTVAGYITLFLSWSFVTGLSIYLVIKTLRTPPPPDDQQP